MKFLYIVGLLFASQLAYAEDLDKRHDSSVFSCNEIRADYVTSGDEKFYQEYQKWCSGDKLYPQEILHRGDVNPSGDVIYIEDKNKK